MVFVDQCLDELLHVADMFCCTWQMIGLTGDLDTQLFSIFNKCVAVERGNGVGIIWVEVDTLRQFARFLRLGQSLARCSHLVLPPAVGDRVIGHVPYVGQVHHLLNVVPS